MKTEALPDFEAPPINEVVCGIQLEDLEKWQTIHFGILWQQVREHYPKFTDQPPLQILPDLRSAVPELKIPQPRIPHSGLVPLRRVWLIEDNERYLMQVDPPRFLHNWRKVKDQDPYPRFKEAYARFATSLEVVDEFIKTFSLGKGNRNQYELSYINHIFVEPGCTLNETLNTFLTFVSWKSSFLSPPTSEEVRLQIDMPDQRGILTIVARHGFRKSDSKEAIILDLTCRGLADPEGSDMHEWFEMAHEIIVRGFTEITTTEAHKIWKRKV